jgi:hypothetical protein
MTNTFTATAPATVTPTASPLRRPQTSPRSPLTSVRNMVAALKERTPAKLSPKSSPGSATSASSPPYVLGHLGLRRQSGRIGGRTRRDRSQSQADSEDSLRCGGLDAVPERKRQGALPLLEDPTCLLMESCYSLRGLVCFGISTFTRGQLQESCFDSRT